MISMELLVKCENAMKKFGRIKALDNINLDIKAGQIVGLLGENGSGKTSLLNCMAGLSHLNSGDMKVNNVSVQDYRVKKELAYMPGINFFSPKWTVKKAVHNFVKLFDDFNKEKNSEMLKKLDIDENTEFRSMSSGTLAKAKLAFILSREVKLYLLDEPFANIDLIAREELYSLILSEFNPETTIILSTHFINEIEMLFDKAVLMREGRIEADISVENYKEKNNKSIVEFYKEIMKKQGIHKKGEKNG